jgi:carboxymethylenebutenolidase
MPIYRIGTDCSEMSKQVRSRGEKRMPETVAVETADGEMGIYDAQPQGPVSGAVIVLQEAFGVNDHIEDVCRRFAAAGYRAVAPHLFHRSGDPVLSYGDIEKVMPHMQALSEAGLGADLDATSSYLESLGFGLKSTGVVGFCMGGTVAFLAAARYPLGAAVTFYGGGVAEGRFGMPSLVELASELQTPWLGLFGDLDQGIPVEHVETLRVAISGAPVEAEIVRYADADHGFHCDARQSYHEESARDAWSRTLDWFACNLRSD